MALTITFTVPTNKTQRLVTAIVGLHPNIEVDGKGDPKYTNTQWAKEVLRRQVLTWVWVYENRVAKAAVSIAKDENILS